MDAMDFCEAITRNRYSNNNNMHIVSGSDIDTNYTLSLGHKLKEFAEDEYCYDFLPDRLAALNDYLMRTQTKYIITSLEELILLDIYFILHDRNATKIDKNTLIEDLCKLSNRPWSSYNNGARIELKQVDDLLWTYGICSKYIGFSCEYMRGYRKIWFRYVGI